MKCVIAFVVFAVNQCHATAEVWETDACVSACADDTAESVSLLQKHVRPAARKPRDMKAMKYGGDDVGAIAAALTHEIDDVLEQTVRSNQVVGQDDANRIKNEIAGLSKNTGSSSIEVHVPHQQGETVVDVKISGMPVMTKIPIDVDQDDDKDEEEDAGDKDEKDDEDNEDQDDDEVSEKCQESLEKLLNDQHRVEKATQCESKHGDSDKAIEALQKMDTKSAIKSIQKMFTMCGGLSKSCAMELAPQEMLKMRLSGVTMEQQCADVASEQDMNPDEKSVKCQTKMGQAIVDALMTGDIADALDKAQDGLAECNDIEHPCDFQLAPLLVGQLIQSQEDQPSQELQPGGMFLGYSREFASLVDAVIKPSYYQAMLLQM